MTTTTTMPLERALTLDPSQVTAAERQPMDRATRSRWILFTALVLAGVMVARLRNTAFIDEALYINAGHAWLDHWFDDVPVGDAGAFFSGVPVLYPVLAAVLDSVGGLYLVRAFSFLCVAGAALLMRSTAAHLWGPRAGLLAAASYLFVGPVLFTAWLGTFDALVTLLLAAALWLGVTRSDYASAAGLGSVLALAAATKYTAGIYAPAILAVTILVGARGWQRAGIAAGTGGLIAGGALLLFGERLARDIAFTTTDRDALTPADAGTLWTLLTDHMVWLMFLALLILALTRRPWRLTALLAVLILTAAMLPVAQFRLGEATSFEKHLAYSALFLAPVIGYGLARFSRRPLMVTPVVVAVMIMMLFGVVRSGEMYRQWTSVAPVVAAIEQNPRQGLYISSASDALDYHTRELPGIAWDTTFELYFEGEEGIDQAVASQRYATVILRTATTGNPTQDERQAYFVEALSASEGYYLAYEPFPASDRLGDNWMIYQRR